MTSSRPFLLLLATTLLVVSSSQPLDDEGAPDLNKILGGRGPGGGGKFCPQFTCPGNYAAIPKWPLSIESAGCQGGMSQATGMDFRHFHKCCDLQTACYQVCGADKAKCDAEFESCVKNSCETLPGLEDTFDDINDLEEEELKKAKDECNKNTGLVTLIRGMNGCGEYDMYQRRNCECVPEDKVEVRMERVLRNFYKKYKPDLIGKVEGLMEKAKGKPANFATILKQLVGKYPASIRRKKVEPRMPPKRTMEDEL